MKSLFWKLVQADLSTKPISKIEDIPNYQDLYGFVYCITNLDTGKMYIGKKALKFTRKKKLSQKTRKSLATKKIFERVVTESNWGDYYGSCKELTSDVVKLGKHRFSRTILATTKTKKYLSYLEMKYQILYNVMGTDSYNGNILNRFFRKDIENG